MRPLRRWRGTVAAIVAVLVILTITIFGPNLKATARNRVQEYLQERFQSEVQFTDFDVSLWPLPGAIIDGLTLTLHDRTNVPPLIKIRRVTLRTGVFGLFEKHIHIPNRPLEGLGIPMPAKQSGARPTI